MLFIMGLFLGVLVGFFTAGLMAAAAAGDSQMQVRPADDRVEPAVPWENVG